MSMIEKDGEDAPTKPFDKDFWVNQHGGDALHLFHIRNNKKLSSTLDLSRLTLSGIRYRNPSLNNTSP